MNEYRFRIIDGQVIETAAHTDDAAARAWALKVAEVKESMEWRLQRKSPAGQWNDVALGEPSGS